MRWSFCTVPTRNCHSRRGCAGYDSVLSAADAVGLQRQVTGLRLSHFRLSPAGEVQARHAALHTACADMTRDCRLQRLMCPYCAES